MERRVEEPIPSFIPIIHQLSKATRPSEVKERYLTTTSTVPILQLVPLAIREPLPLVLPSMDQLQLVIKQATEGFREEMARTMKSLTDQVSNLAMTHNLRLLASYESGQHSIGIWCTIQGCPNPAGHSSQFCPLLLQQGPNSQSTSQYSQQVYQPSQRQEQGRQNALLNSRSQYPVHSLCGRRHPVGTCWIENNIICGKCGGQHPTDRCSKPDKVITLAPPPGDYHQQAQANIEGARSTEQTEPAGPSNLYYDRQNHKQTHTSPTAVQTK